MFSEKVLAFGGYRFFVTQRTLMEGDRQVRIGSRAREILTLLLENAGEVVPKRVLMKRIWPGVYVDEGALRVHIATLRKILGRDRSVATYIENITGHGYRFAAPLKVIHGTHGMESGKMLVALDNHGVSRVPECRGPMQS